MGLLLVVSYRLCSSPCLHLEEKMWNSSSITGMAMVWICTSTPIFQSSVYVKHPPTTITLFWYVLLDVLESIHQTTGVIQPTGPPYLVSCQKVVFVGLKKYQDLYQMPPQLFQNFLSPSRVSFTSSLLCGLKFFVSRCAAVYPMKQLTARMTCSANRCHNKSGMDLPLSNPYPSGCPCLLLQSPTKWWITVQNSLVWIGCWIFKV